MRKFTVSASEKKGGGKISDVTFLIADEDKGTSMRVTLPYGPTLRTRDTAYAVLKDLTGAAIRQRVADELMTAPECPDKCQKGYYDTGGGGLGRCPNPECAKYALAVVNIPSLVDIAVTYKSGTHKDKSYRL